MPYEAASWNLTLMKGVVVRKATMGKNLKVSNYACYRNNYVSRTKAWYP